MTTGQPVDGPGDAELSPSLERRVAGAYRRWQAACDRVAITALDAPERNQTILARAKAAEDLNRLRVALIAETGRQRDLL